MARFPYRTDDHVIEAVKHAAEREQRSANVMLDILVQEALAARERRKQPNAKRRRSLFD